MLLLNNFFKWFFRLYSNPTRVHRPGSIFHGDVTGGHIALTISSTLILMFLSIILIGSYPLFMGIIIGIVIAPLSQEDVLKWVDEVFKKDEPLVEELHADRYIFEPEPEGEFSRRR